MRRTLNLHIGARLRDEDGLDVPLVAFNTSIPKLQPYHVHVAERFSSLAGVMENLPHNLSPVTLASSEAASTHVYGSDWQKRGGMKYYNRARVETRVVITEEREMKGYASLCAMELNLLTDKSYVNPTARTAYKALVVAKIVREIRMGWFDPVSTVVSACKRASGIGADRFLNIPNFYWESGYRWYLDFRRNNCECFTPISKKGMYLKFCIINNGHTNLLSDIKQYLEGQMLRKKGLLTVGTFTRHLNTVIIPSHAELESAFVHPITQV
jgi:hypothetical protein